MFCLLTNSHGFIEPSIQKIRGKCKPASGADDCDSEQNDSGNPQLRGNKVVVMRIFDEETDSDQEQYDCAANQPDRGDGVLHRDPARPELLADNDPAPDLLQRLPCTPSMQAPSIKGMRSHNN